MPELPEVEAIARTLRPLVCGQRIHRVHVFHPLATRPQPPGKLIRLAEGRRIRTVTRRGKYLLLELDRGLIELHFRLDGRLIWFPNARQFWAKVNRPRDGIHVDVAFEGIHGVLAFADDRHFGRVHAWKSLSSCLPLGKLGPDAQSPQFTRKFLSENLCRSRQPIKEFLLNQSKIAGLGNIYSCESLWQAGLYPSRSANSLQRQEVDRLHKAIVSVLCRALKCCLVPAPEFADPDWWFKGLDKILCVYQRERQPCTRCARPIRRIRQGGRSTYCCFNCQK